MSFLSGLKGLFKGSKGLDPTALALGGMSALFGNQPQVVPQSFHKGVSPDAARLVDPIQSLFNALNASNNMSMGLNNRLQQGYPLRSSFVQQGVSPVRIPGLNFQIGGGLATDPALKDPSLLSNPFEGDLYSSLMPNGGQNNPGSVAVPKRRTPTSTTGGPF